MTIIISPYSKQLRNGKNNPKNYPFWKQVVKQIKSEIDCEIIQIGVYGEKKIKGIDKIIFDSNFTTLKEIILSSDVWISVDNAINHLGAYLKKPGIVIFGKSSLKIFGYEQNINLIKDEKFLRENQFQTWEEEKFEKKVFIPAERVVQAVLNYKNRKIPS